MRPAERVSALPGHPVAGSALRPAQSKLGTITAIPPASRTRYGITARAAETCRALFLRASWPAERLSASPGHPVAGSALRPAQSKLAARAEISADQRAAAGLIALPRR
ncbi:hypothetical protein AXJ11_gp89 [Gordonia phage GordDuk1]|uniref:Uncharacterized protein n=1 Tax=Gordonia phage GordDuk1 TaxID=1622191 RepID=A0A0E3XBJ9_9CAUD|nr:hypothetical protein AXJ11_gp89 [Gordonia phage GordDuk1]AKC03017.1 hypothetical protein GordDuk1_89 [Gordonia phage GordDuk1]